MEAQEFFDKDQIGSSAMPHKRNPIGSENLSGLARILRANAGVGFDNQSTWDGRDISNSGAERVIVPDSSILLDYMLNRMTGIVTKLIVHPGKMIENLNLTKGLIFSQEITDLIASKSNLPSREVYKLVWSVAQPCWETGGDFFQALLNDKKIMQYVTDDELRRRFNLEEKIQHIDYIFKRVFEKED